ncbi:MAG: hypothetical protein PWQ57_2885 [Desulfovibrionales bacterium]|nr:hypothetical protein [Desulfovibrionales bacterium]
MEDAPDREALLPGSFVSHAPKDSNGQPRPHKRASETGCTRFDPKPNGLTESLGWYRNLSLRQPA